MAFNSADEAWTAANTPVASVFVQRSVALARESNYTGGHFEPLWGADLGGAFNQDPRIGDNFNLAVGVFGKQHAAALVYVPWGEMLPQPPSSQAIADGAALQVAWEPGDGLVAVGDDSYLHAFAAQLAGVGVPVFLSFGAEMNGDWAPWGGNPALYIQKFQLVASVMHREAPNVAMVWAPNHYPYANLTSYYSGDAYVDWVGVDFYTEYYQVGDPSVSPRYEAYYLQGEDTVR